MIRSIPSRITRVSREIMSSADRPSTILCDSAAARWTICARWSTAHRPTRLSVLWLDQRRADKGVNEPVGFIEHPSRELSCAQTGLERTSAALILRARLLPSLFHFSGSLEAKKLEDMRRSPCFMCLNLLAQTAIAAPDIRTAIATEQLVTATWTLAAVGFVTLLAAAAAALAAFKLFALEATPGLVVTQTWMAFEDQRQYRTELYVVARDPDPAGGLRSPLPPPTIREPLPDDNLNISPGLIEVRNFGRTAIVAAELTMRIRTSEIDTAVDLTDGQNVVRNVVGSGSAKITGIAANSAVILHMVGLPNGCELLVEDVTAQRPGRGRAPRKRYRVPFVAAPITTGMR